MGRMKQGWQLTKKSWAILRGNRQLMWFAVLGGLTAMVAMVVIGGAGAFLLVDEQTAPGVALVVLGIYLATFLGIYFNVGLAAAADRVLHGESATIADGLAVARTRIGPIAGWALFAMTVNLLLNLLRNQDNILGQIVAGLVSVAWSLATFLVVPVIALEGIGPVSALKRSAGLFRQKWGQQVTGVAAIGFAVILFVVLPALAIGAAGVLLSSSATGPGIALIAAAVLVLVAGAVAMAALRGVFGVVLFHYATSGEAVGGFQTAELDSAVRMKR